jgi:DNA gyrase inhibitor GyrI
MLKISAILISVLICIFIVLSWFGGVFDRVVIKRTRIGPYHTVYRTYQGTYSGFRFLIKNVADYVRSKNIDSLSRGFAVFYDDPSEKSQDSLRFAAGVITDKKITVEPPYLYMRFDTMNVLAGEYPIKSFFSYINGYYKFKDALNQYLSKSPTKISRPFFEIYDMKKKKIVYIAPVGSISPVPPFDTLPFADQ